MADPVSGTLRGSIAKKTLNGSINSGGLSGGVSIPHQSTTVNYNSVRNKPSINGVELVGNVTTEDLYIVSENTTAGWNENPQYLPKKGEICIYTDYYRVEDDMGNEIVYPAIKIGDGNAYLIDIPFADEGSRYQILQELRAHEANASIHVSQQDRDFWNNKLNYNCDGEELILTRN